MLKIVPKPIRVAIFLALAMAFAALAGAGEPLQGISKGAGFQQPVSPLAATPQQPASPSGTRTIQTVVLDPAHGGTDEGAHGSGGIVEKDVVLTLARVVEGRLENAGLRVVMTRQSDQTLSFEQRAAIANAQHHAIFISLHVGSSGTVGSAYTYYYDFSQVVQNQNGSSASGLVDWDRAQLSWQPLSERLAQLLQVELSERLPGSPELPTGAAVYQLREIDEPAVAIEVENVNAPSAAVLDQLGKPLAKAITRAIEAFQIVYQKGAS